MELFGLEAIAMAVFAGPKPFLSLNPQEEAKFQKEVAQARRRATQVSSTAGRTERGGGRRVRVRFPALERFALLTPVLPPASPRVGRSPHELEGQGLPETERVMLIGRWDLAA